MNDETTAKMPTFDGLSEELTPVAPQEPTASPSSVPDAAPHPRVRWAAIIWGIAFATVATALLVTLTDADRRDAAAAWWQTTSPSTIALTLLAGLGAVLLVAGLAGLARRAGNRAVERP
ncbi:hypothetical protein WDJ51_12285 [Rathayibacter sp. YIM 133350]|uniref:hypothetical protein n=1 Tax=Rathayibacter sp. YIM 133350 TaxID=3131992 RepID=UPI00307F5F5B